MDTLGPEREEISTPQSNNIRTQEEDSSQLLIHPAQLFWQPHGSDGRAESYSEKLVIFPGVIIFYLLNWLGIIAYISINQTIKSDIKLSILLPRPLIAITTIIIFIIQVSRRRKPSIWIEVAFILELLWGIIDIWMLLNSPVRKNPRLFWIMAFFQTIPWFMHILGALYLGMFFFRNRWFLDPVHFWGQLLIKL